MDGSNPAHQDDFSFVGSSSLLQRKEPAPAARRPLPAQQAAPASAAAQPAQQRHAATPGEGAAQRPAAVPVLPPAAPLDGSGQTGNAGPSRCSRDQVNPNAILVSRRQEGNPLLRHIRSVRWQYADIVPDYQMGAGTCALFLSLRFHLLKPEYVHHRIKQMQRGYRLRIILCHVDIEDVVESLNQVTRAAVLNDCTLFCAFSSQECARYLETFKSFETKPADAIQGRVEEDYLSRLHVAMTTVRGVNRTNVLTLGRAFKSVAGIMQADMEELLACPGIGPTKVRRLYETFHEPFRRTLHDSDAAQADIQPVGAPLPADAPAADSTAGAAGSAAVTTDGIAEIGGGDDDVGADDPHAGAFMFL